MSRTLSVFEHETLRVGNGPRHGLTNAQFEALVRHNDLNGQRFFSVGHRSVTFRQFVGYLQIGNLGIEVLPKADHRDTTADIPLWRDALLQMLSVALGLDLDLADTGPQELRPPTLLELIVAQFAVRIERLIHEGLTRGYRQQESNGSTFRGRFLFTEHTRHNHSRADRCYVRYAEFDRDVPVNRLIRAALDTAQLAALSAPLKARVLVALHQFEGVSKVVPRSSDFDRLVLNRSTQRYEESLMLARMILDNLSPALRSGKDSVFSMMFDMNKLWEGYIGALFRRAAVPGVRAMLQSSTSFWAPTEARARTLRPDIVLQDTKSKRSIAVLDTKWKVAAGGPSADDLQQMFAYNEMFSSPTSVLIYPAVGTHRRVTSSATFTSRSHGCATLELDLDRGGRHSATAMLPRIRKLVQSLAEPGYDPRG